MLSISWQEEAGIKGGTWRRPQLFVDKWHSGKRRGNGLEYDTRERHRPPGIAWS